MSFRTEHSLPSITWSDRKAMNALVEPRDRQTGKRSRPLDELRSRHRRCMERFLIAKLRSAEFMCLSAIVSRTFGWSKIIEAIPLKVFAEGMRDRDLPDHWQTGDDDMPHFPGTNLGISTISRALNSPAEKHLIERFQISSTDKTTYAYMPVSSKILRAALEPSTIDFADWPLAIAQSSLEERPWGEDEGQIMSWLPHNLPTSAQDAA